MRKVEIADNVKDMLVEAYAAQVPNSEIGFDAWVSLVLLRVCMPDQQRKLEREVLASYGPKEG